MFSNAWQEISTGYVGIWIVTASSSAPIKGGMNMERPEFFGLLSHLEDIADFLSKICSLLKKHNALLKKHNALLEKQIGMSQESKDVKPDRES